MLLDEEPLYQEHEDGFRSWSLTQLGSTAIGIWGTKEFHLLSMADVGLIPNVGGHPFSIF